MQLIDIEGDRGARNPRGKFNLKKKNLHTCRKLTKIYLGNPPPPCKFKYHSDHPLEKNSKFAQTNVKTHFLNSEISNSIKNSLIMGCITEMTKLVILVLLKRDIESLDIKKTLAFV